MNKKSTFFALVILALTLNFSCKGPQGEVGPQGPKGDTGAAGATGATGATGAAGKDGTNTVSTSTARYYDYKLSWAGTTSGSTSDFTIPNFKPNSEFAITYILSGSLIKQLPLKDEAAFESDGNTINIVDMTITYGSSGLTFTREWRYKENGVSEYKFRTVVIPMIQGGRLNSIIPYETLKKMYNIPD